MYEFSGIPQENKVANSVSCCSEQTIENLSATMRRVYHLITASIVTPVVHRGTKASSKIERLP